MERNNLKRILCFIALSAMSTVPFTSIVQAQQVHTVNLSKPPHRITTTALAKIKPVSAVTPATQPKPPAQPVAGPVQPTPLVAPISTPAPVAQQPLAPVGFPFAPMGTYANGFDPGQCTWGAASMKGNVPNSWGNANNWAIAAQATGYAVSSTPVVGAVAQTSRGTFGHVAVVIAVTPDGSAVITEMNWDYAGSVRTRVALPGEFVYIYM